MEDRNLNGKDKQHCPDDSRDNSTRFLFFLSFPTNLISQAVDHKSWEKIKREKDWKRNEKKEKRMER